MPRPPKMVRIPLSFDDALADLLKVKPEQSDASKPAAPSDRSVQTNMSKPLSNKKLSTIRRKTNNARK